MQNKFISLGMLLLLMQNKFISTTIQLSKFLLPNLYQSITNFLFSSSPFSFSVHQLSIFWKKKYNFFIYKFLIHIGDAYTYRWCSIFSIMITQLVEDEECIFGFKNNWKITPKKREKKSSGWFFGKDFGSRFMSDAIVESEKKITRVDSEQKKKCRRISLIFFPFFYF